MWTKIALSARLLLGTALPPPPTQQGQAQAQPSMGQPQTGLPVVEISAGLHRIRAELAATPNTRSTGLMHRRSLGPNQGMLFVFPDRAGHCFWMRNTLLPLSIAFIADDGRIVNIADMEPMTENPHCPAQAVRLALEMEQGWFARRGIEAGQRLGLPEVSARP
jgi:uncharacterized membrane protein (UPF0127 family)